MGQQVPLCAAIVSPTHSGLLTRDHGRPRMEPGRSLGSGCAEGTSAVPMATHFVSRRVNRDACARCRRRVVARMCQRDNVTGDCIGCRVVTLAVPQSPYQNLAPCRLLVAAPVMSMPMHHHGIQPSGASPTRARCQLAGSEQTPGVSQACRHAAASLPVIVAQVLTGALMAGLPASDARRSSAATAAGRRTAGGCNLLAAG